MKNFFGKAIASFVLVVAMAVNCVVPAFAAENVSYVEPANSRAVVQLDAGREQVIYPSLTFTNQYRTNTYNVPGQWINLKFDFRTADGDQGLGGIWLNVYVYNAADNSCIYSVRDYVPNKGQTAGTEFTFDLGSNVRSVYFVFDASSYGSSNGHYRSATMTNVRTLVFG